MPALGPGPTRRRASTPAPSSSSSMPNYASTGSGPGTRWGSASTTLIAESRLLPCASTSSTSTSTSLRHPARLQRPHLRRAPRASRRVSHRAWPNPQRQHRWRRRRRLGSYRIIGPAGWAFQLIERLRLPPFAAPPHGTIGTLSATRLHVTEAHCRPRRGVPSSGTSWMVRGRGRASVLGHLRVGEAQADDYVVAAREDLRREHLRSHVDVSIGDAAATRRPVKADCMPASAFSWSSWPCRCTGSTVARVAGRLCDDSTVLDTAIIESTPPHGPPGRIACDGVLVRLGAVHGDAEPAACWGRGVCGPRA
jgi:hypothetical protein